MKKINSILIALMVLVAVTSCSGDSETNINQLGIVSESPYVYADQKVDSFVVLSNKSWNAKVTESWAYLDTQSSFGICTDPSVVSTFAGVINFETNNTGKVRYVDLQAENGDHTVKRTYLQTYWHNITYPTVTYNANYTDATFTLLATTAGNSYEIEFTLYQGATLSTSTEWLKLSATQFKKGKNSADIIVATNTTGQERIGEVELTSADKTVTSKIIVRQSI